MAKTLTSEQVKEGFEKLPLADQIAVFKSIKTILEDKKKEHEKSLESLSQIES